MVYTRLKTYKKTPEQNIYMVNSSIEVNKELFAWFQRELQVAPEIVQFQIFKVGLQLGFTF